MGVEGHLIEKSKKEKRRVGYIPRGSYWDDLSVGDHFESGRRTMTETDIVQFSGLSGDTNPLHTDEVFAQTTQFGRRIAHGMLILSVATGLVNQLALFEGTTLAVLDISARWLRPTYPGDTLSMDVTVAEKKESQKTDRGVVTVLVRALNQQDEMVMESTWHVLLKRKYDEDMSNQ